MNTSKSLKILLVEDNVLNQKLIFLNLNKLGYDIDLAQNGKVAVSMVESNCYDLVIMDLMMPVMDGLSATIKIRESELCKSTYTPIIGLTANTFDADRQKCLTVGMDEYMSKPFDLELFKEILVKLDLI